jgi:phage-related protein
MVFHIHGICQNPRITHSNGTYVEVLTTMAKDDVLVIDCENFTAEKNGSSVIGSLRHAGDPAFMVLLPGTNLLTLTSDVTPAAAFSVIYNPRYL